MHSINSLAGMLLFLLSFLIAGLNPLLGQDETINSIFLKADEIADSTKRQDFLEDQIWSYRVKDVKLAIALIDSVAEERGGKDAIPPYSRLIYYYGILYKNDSQFDNSENSFLKFRAYFEDKNDSLRLSSVNNTLGSLMFDQSKFAESIDYYNQALSYTSPTRFQRRRLVSLARLGNIMDKMERYDDARSYINESLDLAISINDSFEIGNNYMNLGLSLESGGQLDSAMVFYNKAQKYFEGIGSIGSLMLLNSNIAVIKGEQEKFHEMKSYAQKSNKVAVDIGNQKMAIITALQLGLAEVELGNLDQGITKLKKVLENDSEAMTNNRKRDINKALYIAYKGKGMLSKALQHHEAFYENSQSVLDNEIASQVNTLERRFDTQRKETRIDNLLLTEELSQNKISNQRTMIMGLGLGLLFFGILGYLLYRQRNQIKSQNEIIKKALDDKDVLLKEIHHRVKNNLQMVSSLLTLQSRQIKDSKAIEAINEGKARVRSMALIHQNLYVQENLTGVNAKAYLEKLTSELFNTYNIDQDRIKLVLNIEDLNLDIDTIVPLGLIINELVTNSLKYAFPKQREGELVIDLTDSNEGLVLNVKDNGIGMKKIFSESKSFGNKLIAALTEQLEGEMYVDPKEGMHTKILFKDYKMAS